MIQWGKNAARSSKEIFEEWFYGHSGFQTIRDELKSIKKSREKFKKSNAKNPKSLFQFLKDQGVKSIEEYERKAGVPIRAKFKEFIEEMKTNIKTGDFNHAKKKGMDDFDDLDELDAMFDDLDEELGEEFDDENVGEGFSMGGKMSIYSIKNKYIRKIKISSWAESNELAGPVPAINSKLLEIKEKIGHVDDTTSRIDNPTIFDKIELSRTKEQIMNEIKIIVGTIARSDSLLTEEYKESIADSIMALFSVKAEVDCRDLYSKSATEIKSEINCDVDCVKNISGTIGDTLEEKANELVDAIDDVNDSLDVSPEDISIGEFGESGKDTEATLVSTLAGFSLGSVLVAAFIAPINALIRSRNVTQEMIDGSALSIRQPLIATDDISKNVVASYAKYLETDTAIQMKRKLESTIARYDEGNIVQRSKLAMKDMSTDSNVRTKKGAMGKEQREEIYSAFSQSYDLLSHSVGTAILRNPIGYDVISGIRSLVSSGEAGEFINDNRHSPTSTIQVEISYLHMNDLTKLSSKVEKKKTSLTMDVTGRRLPYNDVVKTLTTLNQKYFTDIKVTPGEKDTTKKLQNLLAFWKREKKDDKLKMNLEANSFGTIINKIQDVKSPLFHLAISRDAYKELANNGYDLKNPEIYKKTMKTLPIISISIIDEDSETIEASHGYVRNFTVMDFNSIEGEISKYEKELQAILKYGAQR